MKSTLKKVLAVAALALAFVAVGLRIQEAQAITVPYAQSPRIALYNEAGLNVAAGAVINSAVFNLDKVSECTIIADNSAGGSARNLTANWIASDGVTVIYSLVTVVALGTRQLLTISPTAATASLPATVAAIPAQTGRRMSFQLSAAGAAVGSLAIICQ